MSNLLDQLNAQQQSGAYQQALGMQNALAGQLSGTLRAQQQGVNLAGLPALPLGSLYVNPLNTVTHRMRRDVYEWLEDWDK